MKPITPIVPGFDMPTVVYAKDQPQYIPLPAYRTDDGMVVTRWRGTWKERLRFLLFGDLWLSMLTYNQPLQPVKLELTCPIKGYDEEA